MASIFALVPSDVPVARAAGVWLLRFDLPGEKVNKLSREVMDAFGEVMPKLVAAHAKEGLKALVLVSGKPGNFIAGADIEMIRSARTAAEAEALSSAGHRLANAWEDLPFPTIAAIDGAALGGGCELALASTAIVMSMSPAAKIGLPETMLGVIPGMGGCVRLPRKVGIAAALDMILAAKTLNGERAHKAGLAEAVIPAENFEEYAQRWVVANLKALQAGRNLAKEPKLGGSGGVAGKVLEGTPFGRSVIYSKAREGVMAKTRGKYPAVLEAIDVLRDTGAGHGPKLKGAARDRALKREAEGFGKAAATAVSKNLIGLFFLTEGVKKSRGVSGDERGATVRVAGVLGAGIMGGGIAQLFADKGIVIRMKDLNAAALATGMQAAGRIWKKQKDRRRISARQYLQKMNLISPTTDYAGFKSTDLVVEAIVENLDVKKKVLAELEGQVREDCVLASNTSSLSITKMGEALARPENFAGMHFFNPVAKMPLVEVIRGEKSSDRAVASVYQLCKALGKTPIVVKDAPGFLVNRLLMPYLNEATWLLAEGVPIPELDEAMLEFGMPMGPMELIDEVGIDVGDKVAHILHEAFGPRMQPSPVNGKVVAAGRLGKKNGKGLYLYADGGRRRELDPSVYGLLGVTPKPKSVSAAEIVDRCTLPMINEAARCLEEGVVASAGEVDLGMIMGTGFPPFRGGLLRYADSVGAAACVEKLRALEKRFGARYAPAPALVKLASGGGRFHS